MRRLVFLIILVVAAAIALPAYFALRGSDVGIGNLDPGSAVDLAKDVSGGDAAEGDSFYVAANLAPEVAKLVDRFGADGRLDIKIEQRALKMTAKPAGGDAVSVTIGASGNSFDAPAPGIAVSGPRIGAIDATAVEAIARGAARRAGVTLQDIAYITTSITEAGRWVVFLDDGRRFEARLDGSGLQARP